MAIRPETKGDRILRSLARGFAALILLLPVNSYALGLGEIKLHSALNQPLDAEISLLSADSVNLQEINVELASSDAFAQAEIERPVFLMKVKFEVDTKPDGTKYIRVTSEDSIKEPFLDFLIEINWPSGRLLREYTVLLDPPVLLSDKPGAIESPETGTIPSQSMQGTQGVGKTAETPVKSQQKRTAPQFETPAGGLQYGPVTRTDTLWSIATQLKPNKSVTVQQVMMALLKSNPEAFYNNNINDLKAGYVLRISDPGLITAMNAEEALQESRLQYQQWLDAKRNAGQAPGLRPIGSDMAASTVPATSAGETSSGAKLKLVAPAAEEGAPAMDSQSARAELGALREELAIALETSDVTRQENEELRTRITALEEQLASMQRLVTLKDDTMAAIQGSAAQPDAGTQAMDKTQAAPAVEMSVPEMTQQAVPPPPPVPAAAAEEGAISMLLKDPLTLGLGGLVIVVVIVLIWMRMRQRQLASEGFDEGILAAAEQVADESDSAMASAVGGYAAESAIDAIETDSDEMDVLAEADVYLAYRRFDKAIELLNEALQNEPERSDYKLKLMEVYAESENVDGFVAQAEQLYAAIGPQGGPVWDRVVQLGKRLTPDHPLFSGGESENSGDTSGAMDNPDDDEPDLVMSGIEEDLSYTDSTEESPAENIFASNFEDSADVVNELKSENVESEPAGAASDEESDKYTDENALNFDMSDETEVSGEPAAAESGIDDLSFESMDNEPEEAVTEDKSNTIEFESGLLPQSDMEEAHSAAEDENRPPVSEDTGNTIEFESGFAPEQSLEEDKEKNIAGDIASEEADNPENALEFDLDTMADEAADESDAISFEEQGESEAEIQIEGQAEDAEEKRNAADDDLGLDGDDLDWLSNIDDDLSLENTTEDAEGEVAFSTGGDEVDTKLDLAKAYIDMDDKESARGILDEVVQEGNEDQKREAQELIQQLG